MAQHPQLPPPPSCIKLAVLLAVLNWSCSSSIESPCRFCDLSVAAVCLALGGAVTAGQCSTTTQLDTIQVRLSYVSLALLMNLADSSGALHVKMCERGECASGGVSPLGQVIRATWVLRPDYHSHTASWLATFQLFNFVLLVSDPNRQLVPWPQATASDIKHGPETNEASTLHEPEQCPT